MVLFYLNQPVIAGYTGRALSRALPWLSSIEREPTHCYAFLGDPHTAFPITQLFLDHIAQADDVDALFILGDISENEYGPDYREFFRLIDGYEYPIYLMRGNHDCGFRNGEVSRYYWDRNARPIGRYSVRLGNVTFIVLETGCGNLTQDDIGWLSAQLSGDTRKVVLTHIPFVTEPKDARFAYANRPQGRKIMSLMADNGAELLITGHIHPFQLSAWRNVTIINTGGGGGTLLYWITAVDTAPRKYVKYHYTRVCFEEKTPRVTMVYLDPGWFGVVMGQEHGWLPFPTIKEMRIAELS